MKYSIILLILIFQHTMYGQFRSLYSMNGDGKLNSSIFGENKFCGELSAAYMNGVVINKQNPASYANSNLTIIDIGARGQSGSYTYMDSIKSSGGITMSHIAFLFPLKTAKAGLSMGFAQNSTVNYSIKSSEQDATFGQYNYTKSGFGNTYNAYIGAGYKMGDISFGSNINVIFGNIKYNQDVTFIDSSYFPLLRTRHDVSVLNLGYDIGALYYKDLNKKNAISIGGYYKGNFTSNSSERYTRLNINTISSTSNTTYVLQDSNATISRPSYSKLGFGVNLYLNQVFVIGTEFNYAIFSNYIDQFTGLALQNSWHLNTGLEYKPILNREINSRKYFNRITYRVGTIIGKSEQNIDGSINDLKITGGLTCPVMSRSVSMISLGFQYQKLGLSTLDKYSESIFSIFMQITFADKWFLRPKFD